MQSGHAALPARQTGIQNAERLSYSSADEHQLSRHPATKSSKSPNHHGAFPTLKISARAAGIILYSRRGKTACKKIMSAFVLVGKEPDPGLFPCATKQEALILSALVAQCHVQSRLCSSDLGRPCLLPAGDATARLFSGWEVLGGAAGKQQAQRDEPAEACTEQVIISVLCNYSWEGVNLWCTNLPTVYCRRGNKTDS